jgi:hypothetical protein
MPLPLCFADQFKSVGRRCRLPLVLLHIARLFLSFELMLKEGPYDLITPVQPRQARREACPALCLLILPYFVLRSLLNARHLQARSL